MCLSVCVQVCEQQEHALVIPEVSWCLCSSRPADKFILIPTCVHRSEVLSRSSDCIFTLCVCVHFFVPFVIIVGVMPHKDPASDNNIMSCLSGVSMDTLSALSYLVNTPSPFGNDLHSLTLKAVFQQEYYLNALSAAEHSSSLSKLLASMSNATDLAALVEGGGDRPSGRQGEASSSPPSTSAASKSTSSNNNTSTTTPTPSIDPNNNNIASPGRKFLLFLLLWLLLMLPFALNQTAQLVAQSLDCSST